jgi:DNA-binding PadR family transcriptional regulator
MSQYHQSGTRRDICVLLYDAGELRGQQLKSELSKHYGRRIDPTQFYGVLDALVDSRHVEKRKAGLHDLYALTEAGKQALLDQYEWMQSRVGAN